MGDEKKKRYAAHRLIGNHIIRITGLSYRMMEGFGYQFSDNMMNR